MSWVDIAILVVIIISCGISVLRGFVKEAISLTSWVLAFVLSMTLADNLAMLLQNSIEQPHIRTATAYAILFITTLMVGGLASFMLGTMIEKTGLTGADRTLGAIFGFVRGVIIVCVVTTIGGMTALPQTTWWSESFLLEYFVSLVQWIVQFIPDEIAKYIVF